MLQALRLNRLRLRMAHIAQTYLVTGANRGIGLELVRALRARGDTVYATTRSGNDADLATLGAKVIALDLSDSASITALSAKLEEIALDCVINNAGVSSDAKTLEQVTLAELTRVFTVNAFAPILVAQAAKAALARGSRKVVCNISSQLASITNNTGGSTYAYRGSKTALNQMNMSLANELRGEGFCCISVHPGWVRTDMGGEKAPMLPPQSAAHIVTLIDGVKAEDSGKFFNFDGAKMPW